MPDESAPEYTLKRLRELCLGIHEDNIALLLRTTLPEFPISAIDEFFTGSKLNKPSGPDDREWTDIVRLTLIAFAPQGSKPAKLRGKPIERYKRDYPFDPDRPDADEPGKLTLYPTEKTTPILGDIAAGLGVTRLDIKSREWMSCYLTNPFDLREFSVNCGDGCPSNWIPVPGLQSNLSEVLSVLPSSLERLRLRILPKLPMSGASLARLDALKLLNLEVESLPDGIDVSANKDLENLSIDIYSGKGSEVKGVARLTSLHDLSVECHFGSTSMESIDPLLLRGLRKVNLKGISYLSESFEGLMPTDCTLSEVTGIRKIALSPGKVDTNSTRHGISLLKITDLESVIIDGDTRQVSIKDCPNLAELKLRVTCNSATNLEITSCPLLTSAEVNFLNGAEKIILDDLPLLSQITLNSPSGSGVGGYSRDDEFHDTSANFFVRKTGITRPPIFQGSWRGLSVVELVDNPHLESLLGLEVLPDLTEIRIRKLPAMKGFLPVDSKSALPRVTWLRAEHVTLPTPAGFEAFPALTKLDLLSCSLDELTGIEPLECLETADLSSSSIKSIAPLAALPVLKSVKVSGCYALKPKPPHVLLEGMELESEFARATGPDHSVTKSPPSEELTKIVQLIGDGTGADIIQATKLMPALSQADQERLLKGATIDPKTQWVRLPYLTKIKDEVALGIPQLRILQGIEGGKADELFNPIRSIVINGDIEECGSTIRVGKKTDSSANDAVLQEFNSIGSLPDLPNLTMISINGVTRFSVEGVEKFPRLTSLFIGNVNQLEGVESLKKLGMLQKLSLCGVNMSDLSQIGLHPELQELQIHSPIESLNGLENFPALNSLLTHSCMDITGLLSYAVNRNCRVSCDAYSDYRYLGDVIRFSFNS
jgi:hypothetical protein